MPARRILLIVVGSIMLFAVSECCFGIIWKIFEAERRGPVLIKDMPIVDIPIIKQGDFVFSCFDNDWHNKGVDNCCYLSLPPAPQSHSCTFVGLTSRGRCDRKSKLDGGTLPEAAPPKTIVPMYIVCWCRSAVPYGYDNDVVKGAFRFLDRLVDPCGVASWAFQGISLASYDDNICSQLTLCRVNSVVGGTFRFVGEPTCFIAERVGCRNRNFSCRQKRFASQSADPATSAIEGSQHQTPTSPLSRER